MWQGAPILILCFILANAQTNPGVTVNFRPEGLNELQKIAEPYITSYIEAKEPYQLSSYSTTLAAVFLNFTSLSLSNSTHKAFAYSLNNNEFQVSLIGLGFLLNYDLFYQFPLTSGSSFSSVATIGDSTVTLSLSLKNNNGKIDASISSFVLNIGTLDMGITLSIFTSLLKDLEQYVFRPLINTIIPGQITPTINADLAAALSQLNMTTFLDPDNLTVLDYSLTADPQFDPTTGITLSLKGDIHPTGGSCPYSPAPMPAIEQDYFRFYVSQSLIDCALYTFEQTNVLTQKANAILGQYLVLDNRIGFTLNFTGGSTSTITPQGLTVDLKLNLNFDQKPASADHFLSVSVESVTSVDLYLNITANPWFIAGNVTSIKPSFSVSPSQIGPNVPDKYRQQILATNFTALDEKAAAFVLTILPQLNTVLNQGYTPPFPVPEYLVSPDISLQQGYFFVGFDLPETTPTPAPLNVQ